MISPRKTVAVAVAVLALGASNAAASSTAAGPLRATACLRTWDEVERGDHCRAGFSEVFDPASPVSLSLAEVAIEVEVGCRGWTPLRLSVRWPRVLGRSSPGPSLICVATDFTSDTIIVDPTLSIAAPIRPATLVAKRNRRLPWALMAGGKRVAGGVMVISVKPLSKASARRIWDYQFDDYINTCINDSYPLHASGGHLYCDQWTPGKSRLTVLLRRR